MLGPSRTVRNSMMLSDPEPQLTRRGLGTVRHSRIFAPMSSKSSFQSARPRSFLEIPRNPTTGENNFLKILAFVFFMTRSIMAKDLAACWIHAVAAYEDQCRCGTAGQYSKNVRAANFGEWSWPRVRKKATARPRSRRRTRLLRRSRYPSCRRPADRLRGRPAPLHGFPINSRLTEVSRNQPEVGRRDVMKLAQGRST